MTAKRRTGYLLFLVASAAAAALTRLEKEDYAVILVDCRMPEMDGVEMAQCLQLHPSRLKSVIMMLTLDNYQETAARCRELGVGACIVKPVSTENLATAVAAVVAPVKTAGLQQNLPVAAPRPLLPSLKILLAEDNLVNQKFAVKLLEKNGHKVTVAQNGHEALNHFEQSSFDVILMDVQMPEMNGLIATELIRERERDTGNHIPIIALTAHAMKGDRERCLEAGMDSYLSKPIDARRLFEIIHEVLELAGKGAVEQAVTAAEPRT